MECAGYIAQLKMIFCSLFEQAEDNCLFLEVILIIWPNCNINFYFCRMKGWYVIISHDNSVANKIYWLCIVQNLVGDIFLSSQFQTCPQRRNQQKYHLLFGLLHFLLSTAKIFKGVSLSNLILIILEAIQSLFFFPVNTSTEPLSHHSMSFFFQSKV